MHANPDRDAQHRADVHARWREIDAGRIARVVKIVDERVIAIRRRHEARINRILNANIRPDSKIQALWEAVDEIGGVAGQYAACSKGCSHCCHTPVLLPEQEAVLIGRRIGVRPAQLTGITQRGEIASGYHNPCTFLKNGMCAIYASRPLACRQQFNMDHDALLCELRDDGPSKVPYLNMMDYQTALAMITVKRERRIDVDRSTGLPVPVEVVTPPIVGDIREFFPNGTDRRSTRECKE